MASIHHQQTLLINGQEYIVITNGESKTNDAIDSSQLSNTSSHTKPCTNDEKHEGPYLWSTPAVKLLLTSYSEMYPKLSATFNKKKMCIAISNVLNAHGYPVTSLQCDNKLKWLISNYKKVIDNRSKTGTGRKYCPYFEELDNILHKRPDIHPISEASSTGLPQDIGSREQSDSTDCSTPSPIPETSSNTKASSGKRKTTTSLDKLLDVIQAEYADKKIRYEAFIEKAESRHLERMRKSEEKMEKLDRLVDIQERMLQALQHAIDRF